MSSQSSNFHASNGDAYELWLGRWSRRLANVFLDFVEFPESGELLDVGCGTGALTFAMANRWPTRSVIGVDLATPFISYAQSRRSGDRPTFELGDACALNTRTGALREWRAASVTLDSSMSKRNPSPFGWITRISRITGNRSWAGKGRSVPISPTLRPP